MVLSLSPFLKEQEIQIRNFFLNCDSYDTSFQNCNFLIKFNINCNKIILMTQVSAVCPQCIVHLHLKLENPLAKNLHFLFPCKNCKIQNINVAQHLPFIVVLSFNLVKNANSACRRATENLKYVSESSQKLSHIFSNTLPPKIALNRRKMKKRL